MNARRLPLAARLTRMNLMVSGAVLLIAAVAFFCYYLLSFRADLVRDLDVQAQVIGDNSVSALTFDDPQTASAALASLRRSPDVLSAILLTEQGAVFARYRAPGQSWAESLPLGPGQRDHAWVSGVRVLAAHRIVFQGKPLGVLYISARLGEIRHRALQYFIIACIILIFCMIAALLISSFARRWIAQPIISLADTALKVSRDQDYAVRANAEAGSQEIAVLVDAFNAMLAQIEERDAALGRARDELEVRVAQRTAELQNANRELEAFSYTVAHDLRNPLDAINNIAFLLSQSWAEADDPGVSPLLGQLRGSIANMGSLIDDLLNFARASTAPVDLAPVDLSAIARGIANDLSASGPGRQVEFVIGETPQAMADPGLMRIVLDNLLRNSWKYTSHHPSARIEFGAIHPVDSAGDGGGAAEKAAQGTVYFVRDDGAGFDPALAGRLFQPFERLHGKSEFPGTGIGLATVRRILLRQGGTIWAEGSVEQGAAFYFTLG